MPTPCLLIIYAAPFSHAIAAAICQRHFMPLILLDGHYDAVLFHYFRHYYALPFIVFHYIFILLLSCHVMMIIDG